MSKSLIVFSGPTYVLRGDILQVDDEFVIVRKVDSQGQRVWVRKPTWWDRLVSWLRRKWWGLWH